MKTVISTAEEKMNKTMDALAREFASVRAGRANPSVLDKVSVAEARVLQIQPYDASVLKEIEKAIQVSDIGINPQNDGRVLRLIFPPLTEERRKDLVKDVRKIAEDSKVAVRSIRRDAIEKLKALKKDNEITEDDQANAEKKIQTLTDKFCKEVDEVAAAKEKEILAI